MRVQLSGKVLVFQTSQASSILATRSIFMTHRFAVVVDKKFYIKVQNNNEFYLRIMALDVIRALETEETNYISDYDQNTFIKIAEAISKSIRFFEGENEFVFYLEVSSSYLNDFFQKPLDDIV